MPASIGQLIPFALLLIGAAVLGALLIYLILNERLKEADETNQRLLKANSSGGAAAGDGEANALLEMSEKERKEMEAQLGNLKSELDQRNKELQELQAESSKASTELQALRAAADGGSAVEIDQQNLAEIERLKNELANAGAGSDEVVNQLKADLAAATSGAEAEVSKLKAELEASGKRIADLEASANSGADEMAQKLQAELDASNKKVADLEAAVKNAEASASAAVASAGNGEADAQVADLQATNRKMELEIEGLKKALDAASETGDGDFSGENTGVIRELRAEVQDKNKKIFDMVMKVDDAKKELSEYRIAAKQRDKENTEKIDELNDAIRKMEKQLEELGADGGMDGGGKSAKADSKKKKKAQVKPEEPSKEETLAELREKAKTFDFSRIGTATNADKDDLKMIKGVGPFFEEKLNALGIYTFDQVSKFSSDDIEAVTQATKFFPGRIERDDWKGQASQLMTQKQNTKLF